MLGMAGPPGDNADLREAKWGSGQCIRPYCGSVILREATHGQASGCCRSNTDFLGFVLVKPVYR